MPDKAPLDGAKHRSAPPSSQNRDYSRRYSRKVLNHQGDRRVVKHGDRETLITSISLAIANAK
jgi:hypothetical protein